MFIKELINITQKGGKSYFKKEMHYTMIAEWCKSTECLNQGTSLKRKTNTKNASPPPPQQVANEW